MDQWGGPDHDDEHTWRDWKMFMIRQLGKLTLDNDLTVEFVHDKFVKLAAIAAAAMQSIARKGKI